MPRPLSAVASVCRRWKGIGLDTHKHGACPGLLQSGDNARCKAVTGASTSDPKTSLQQIKYRKEPRGKRNPALNLGQVPGSQRSLETTDRGSLHPPPGSVSSGGAEPFCPLLRCSAEIYTQATKREETGADVPTFLKGGPETEISTHPGEVNVNQTQKSKIEENSKGLLLLCRTENKVMTELKVTC